MRASPLSIAKFQLSHETRPRYREVFSVRAQWIPLSCSSQNYYIALYAAIFFLIRGKRCHVSLLPKHWVRLSLSQGRVTRVPNPPAYPALTVVFIPWLFRRECREFPYHGCVVNFCGPSGGIFHHKGKLSLLLPSELSVCQLSNRAPSSLWYLGMHEK